MYTKSLEGYKEGNDNGTSTSTAVLLLTKMTLTNLQNLSSPFLSPLAVEYRPIRPIAFYPLDSIWPCTPQ
jgi:hypothetical protein